MAARLSTGLITHMMSVGSMSDALAEGVIDVYTGPQPATADAAATGTLLCTITSSGGAYTAETRATGSITLTGGASGSVNTITVGGIDILGGVVAFNTSLTQTAADVATQINRSTTNRRFIASSAGAVVTITAVSGFGAALNGLVVSGTATTITATYGNVAGGVNAINGLRFETAVAGVLSKRTTQTWQGTPTATGVAGWFRFRETTDTGVALSTTAKRYDGAIATSGSEMEVTSTALTLGVPFSIQSASLTLPAA